MTDLTSIEGRVVRPIGIDTFADLTDAPLLAPEGVSADGLLFDGPLTDAETFAIYDRMTSVDDADQARRAVLRETTPCCHACAVTTAYLLGDPLPEPPPA